MEGIDLGAQALYNLELRRDAVANSIASRTPGSKAIIVAEEAVGVEKTSFGDMISKPQPVIGVDFRPGINQGTGVPTHVALNGDKTLFSIDGGKLYSRDGEFHWDAEGKLVNKNNLPVDGGGGPITKTLGAGEASIDKNGNVLQGGQKIGSLSVVEFKDVNQVTPVPGGFVTVDGSQLSSPEYFELTPSSIEKHNGSDIQSITELIKISTAYTANQKVIQHMDERYSNAVAFLSK